MQTMFGFPFIGKVKKGFARLYFKNIVKVTEDFVSYDFLRYLYINKVAVCLFVCSFVCLGHFP